MTILQLDQVTARIHDLPSLPAIVVELLESVDQQDVNNETLASKISCDQALAAKTLRLANSSFYGLQGKVTSIQSALTVLGFRSVRTLVMAVGITSQFTHTAGSAFDFQSFWRHCIGTALAAKALARHVNASEEGAFTAGLLHDIGRLVLVTRFPEHYGEVLAYRAQHDCYLLIAEREILGLDHAMVGHALGQYWKFSPTILAAIAAHHAPEGKDPACLAGVVNIADAIAYALDLSGDENDLVPPLSSEVWAHLGLTRESCVQVFQETESQFESICQILV
ncbi:MAG: HDOD domain-containing protein [Pseudomonadota bacterium]